MNGDVPAIGVANRRRVRRGLVLLAAVLARRPLPVGRLLKGSQAGRELHAKLSVITGAFLTLHALLHLALSITLSTGGYLPVGRVVDLATIAVGIACPFGFVHRTRRAQPPGRADRPTGQRTQGR